MSRRKPGVSEQVKSMDVEERLAYQRQRCGPIPSPVYRYFHPALGDCDILLYLFLSKGLKVFRRFGWLE